MKVIGAGFGRTGTLSTKVALEQLGFAPCYHMMTIFERPADVDVWQAAIDGKPVDWAALFRDFKATVDWPGCTFYKQYLDLYPDAKVLLTVRDPDKWYESTKNTLYAVRHAERSADVVPDMARFFRMIDTLIWEGTFHGRFLDKQYAISVFEQHNQDVKDTVPSDRLLVWDVTQGWEPLCDFLGVAVPENTPFPRLNDTETFRQRFVMGARG